MINKIKNKAKTVIARQNLEECDPNLHGARIVNLENMANMVEAITLHAAVCMDCQLAVKQTGKGVVLDGEVSRKGLASLIQARCCGCCETFRFWTSNKLEDPNGNKHFEVNLSACWGAMSAGSGASGLSEMLSTMGIASISKTSFTCFEKLIGKWWQERLDKDLIEAGKEELRLATAEGKFHEGIPSISVIVDGGWSQRSHKHAYNALGGVAIIIGARTSEYSLQAFQRSYVSFYPYFFPTCFFGS